MSVRITIFTSIIQAILFAVHWFVYATWMSFMGAAKPPGVWAAKIILVLLSVSFVITSLLAFRYSNMLIRIFYTISAVWLGMLSFFFLAASLSRLRSEEHTSELQSRLHLVCRLLLEKKKTL